MIYQTVFNQVRDYGFEKARQGIFYIPLLFILPALLGKTGIYILQPMADLLSVMVSVAIIVVLWKRIFNPEADDIYA